MKSRSCSLAATLKQVSTPAQILCHQLRQTLVTGHREMDQVPSHQGRVLASPPVGTASPPHGIEHAPEMTALGPCDLFLNTSDLGMHTGKTQQIGCTPRQRLVGPFRARL